MIFYDPLVSKVTYKGKEEAFFCGELLDEVAVTLIQLKMGRISLQEAYTLMLKSHICSAHPRAGNPPHEVLFGAKGENAYTK